MQHKFFLSALCIAAVLFSSVVVTTAQGPQPLRVQTALGTGFTYQGQLSSSSGPINGACDFQFGLHDALNGGAQLGSTQTVNSVSVSNGVFTVVLNGAGEFGASAFTGEARWLAISVRCPAGSGGYTALSPRQALTPVPYALALPGLQVQQNATSPNLIGGHVSNTVTSGVVGATIGGGGASNGANQVQASYGTVSGGLYNTAAYTGTTIGGGEGNQATNQHATIGGGSYNTNSGYRATIGGGGANIASNNYATIGGGEDNQASGDTATVGGGWNNQAADTYATVSGGNENRANGNTSTIGGGGKNTASGIYATVSGGYTNTASNDGATVSGGYTNTASGNYATVPGGVQNVAQGDMSFAAGRQARALHDGTFVWADSTASNFNSTAANAFMARATGGVAFVLNTSGTWACSVINGGSWSCSSDRNLKENLMAADGRDVLARLNDVPIYSWNAKGVDPTIKHLGPTAQDFRAAFGLGDSDVAISTIDLDGVALAAIQGLYRITQDQAAQIVTLQQHNAALEARLAKLEQSQAAIVAPAQTSSFNVFNLLSVVALVGVVALWLRQRASQGAKK
jgi:hypothetical protein